MLFYLALQTFLLLSVWAGVAKPLFTADLLDDHQLVSSNGWNQSSIHCDVQFQQSERVFASLLALMV